MAQPDPQRRGRVYVQLSDASLWRSDDDGKSFSRVDVPGGQHHSFGVDATDGRLCLTNLSGFL